MNWENTIKNIRNKKEFSDLVRDAYFDADLNLNLERYKGSEEFLCTKDLLKKYVNKSKDLKIIDIGAGNGISTLSFAEEGYYVYSLEPDPSETVGYGAIKQLVKEKQLENVEIIPSYCESILLKDNTIDVAFARQAMHHAANLEQFLIEIYRILKPGGVLLTVRDHVIKKEADKKTFLDSHPLHKYYGGENAYTLVEYTSTMKKVGFNVVEQLRPFDSPINYAPLRTDDIRKKMRFMGKYDFGLKLGIMYLANKYKNTPGELHSFVCIK